MHSKIKELVKQCHGLHFDDDNEALAPMLCGDSLEKFAELIVRECAEQASLFSINKNQIHPDITYDKMSESAKTVCHITSQQISENIKNYFGVKS
jgi:hypothetical protein